MVAGTSGRATGEELISESLIDTDGHTDHVRLHHMGSSLPSFPERHRGSGAMNVWCHPHNPAHAPQVSAGRYRRHLSETVRLPSSEEW